MSDSTTRESRGNAAGAGDAQVQQSTADPLASPLQDPLVAPPAPVQMAAATAPEPADGGGGGEDEERPAIVEDGQTTESGQMTRSQFLNEARSRVTTTAQSALGPMWEVAGCPYITAWFNRHQDMTATSMLTMARRYAGAGADANAQTLLAGVTEQVKAGVQAWSSGGDISGQLGATGLGDMAGDVPAADGGEPVQRKADMSPEAVVQRMGDGRPLDSGVKSGLGTAFGSAIGDVQVHTGAAAVQMTRETNADAVTVGDHIAFAGGKYQPGSVSGDALIAHEAAHVVQQRRSGEKVQRHSPGGSSSAAETDADRAAAGAMVQMYGGDAGALAEVESSGPALTSGLQMQRCSNDEQVRDQQVRAGIEGVISGLGPPGMPFPSPEAAGGALEWIRGESASDYQYYVLMGGTHTRALFLNGDVDWGAYQRRARERGAPCSVDDFYTGGIWEDFWNDTQNNTILRGNTAPLPL
jgi:hypothetical protein